MLDTLKEIFKAGDEPERPGSISSMTWGKKMTLARAEKVLQRSEEELTEARQSFATAQQTQGEVLADGGDSTAATKAVIKAEQAMKQKESVVAVCRQRVESAKAALVESEREEKLESEERALLDLKRVCERMDATLAALENQINQELVPCIEVAKTASMSNDASVSYLVDLTQGLELHVLKACRSIISRGKAYMPLLGDRHYSDIVPNISTVRARKESR